MWAREMYEESQAVGELRTLDFAAYQSIWDFLTLVQQPSLATQGQAWKRPRMGSFIEDLLTQETVIGKGLKCV